MAAFMDENFLLKTPAARKLFFDYASQMPIIDYHCHLSPQEIYENRGFENLTQAWLGGDHYKWRLMRAAGVEEKYITGDAPDREKFQKYAEVLSRAIGNPLYHWSHLELQRFFGWKGVLRPDTAQEVWDLTCEKLKDPEMRARKLIENSNVKLVCTTDDPADSLIWHEKLAADASFPVKVLPAWRPDQAMNIEKRSFTDYIEKLSEASGVVIKDFDTLLAALDRRMEFFHAHGCRLSDHGLPYAMYAPLPRDQVNDALLRRLDGMPLSRKRRWATRRRFCCTWVAAMPSAAGQCSCITAASGTTTPPCSAVWGRIPALTRSTTTRRRRSWRTSSTRWPARTSCRARWFTA